MEELLLVHCSIICTLMASVCIWTLGCPSIHHISVVIVAEMALRQATSHTRTVVRECFKGDEASQWKRPKFDPSPHQNPLTDLQKIGRREYVLDGTRHAKFCSDRLRGFCSPNTWFAVLLGWLVCSFFGFLNKATAYTPGRIFTQNTSNDVVPGKEVPFGGPDDYILYLNH